MSDYECGYSDDEWSDSEWSPPPSKAQDDAKEARMDAAKLRVIEQQQRMTAMKTAQKEQSEMLQRIISLLEAQDNDDTLQDEPVVVESEDVLEPLVVIAATEVPRVEFEHVSVIQTVTVHFSIDTTEPVVPVTETHVLEIIAVPPVADKPELKPTKVPSKAKNKTKPKKTKLQKTEQRVKIISYCGCYSYSASMRKWREQQLWVEVDPYFDEEQAIFQLWTDMTRPPEDYDSWR